MFRFRSAGGLICLLTTLFASAQQKQAPAARSNKIMLGRLANGAIVSFVRSGAGGWGIEVSGNAFPQLAQGRPVQIEVDRRGNICALAQGYDSVTKQTGEIAAKAFAGDGQAAFAVVDRWKIAGDVLTLNRSVSVMHAEDNASTPSFGFGQRRQPPGPTSTIWRRARSMAILQAMAKLHPGAR